MGTLTAQNTQDVSFIDHADYARPGIAQELFGEPLPALPPVVHLELDSFRRRPKAAPLSRDEERFRFKQYNYARKRARAADGPELEVWAGRASHLREFLTRSNVALVPAAIHTRCHPGDMDSAYSEGLSALLRAVDRFDVSRGWKFSTFACQCILNALSAANARAGTQASRLPTARLDDAACIAAKPDGLADADLSDDVAVLRQALGANTAGLTPNEQYVIEHRFFSCPRVTLHEIGTRIGCSKERVRQIEVAALAKLRAVLAPTLGTDD